MAVGILPGVHGMTTSAPPGRLAPNDALLEQQLPRILAELRQHSALLRPGAGQRSAAAVIQRLFIELYGAASDERQRRRFFTFAAQALRQLVIARMATMDLGALSQIGTDDIRQWLARLESFDKQCAQMIDLHYFVGLSTRRTAEILGVSSSVVIRDLRFAKAWLQARSHWLQRPTARS